MVTGVVHNPVFFWFVSMTCSMYKGPLVYITAIMILAIVQYSFCKSPLEVVVVVPICVLLICYLYLCFAFLWSCIMDPFIVSSFAGTKFDTLWHATLGPICKVLYIFCYVNLVLPMFCCRVAASIFNNIMYTLLV